MEKLTMKALTKTAVSACIIGLTAAGSQAYASPANTLVVAASGGDYTTISAALADTTACPSSGCVIEVKPGTYNENVTMRNGVSLQGAGADVTTISASSIVVLGAANSSISGFTITGGDTGIRYYSSGGTLTIENNTITGNTYYGVSSSQSVSLIVRGNKITNNNTAGVSCSQYGRPVITGNTIENNKYGISLGYCSSAKITRNSMSGNTTKDIHNAYSTPYVSYNIYDTIQNTWGYNPIGGYNIDNSGNAIAP